MKTFPRIVLASLLGGVIGFAVGCSLILDFTPPPLQCWCGEQWRAQIAGATAYDLGGSSASIQTSDTSQTRCVSMLEHLALEAADPQDPIYMALHDAFESEAIANCELAGLALFPNIFDHTDCATTGTDPVATNLVYLGPCWEPGDAEADPICALEQCAGFYDCSQDPIWLWDGSVPNDGETEGSVPWMGEEELWSCDEPVNGIDGPDGVRF